MKKYRIIYDGVKLTPSEWIQNENFDENPDQEKSKARVLLSKIIELFIPENQWFIVRMDDIIREIHFDIAIINSLISNKYLNDEIVFSDGKYLKLTKKAITDF